MERRRLARNVLGYALAAGAVAACATGERPALESFDDNVTLESLKPGVTICVFHDAPERDGWTERIVRAPYRVTEAEADAAKAEFLAKGGKLEEGGAMLEAGQLMYSASFPVSDRPNEVFELSTIGIWPDPQSGPEGEYVGFHALAGACANLHQ